MSDLEEKLDELSNRYGLTWTYGTVEEIRVSSKYESFEFTVNEDGTITNMYHFPPIYRTRTDMHKEFRKNLILGLTVEEAMIYIREHGEAKYRGKLRRFSPKVREKVKKYK